MFDVNRKGVINCTMYAARTNPCGDRKSSAVKADLFWIIALSIQNHLLSQYLLASHP